MYFWNLSTEDSAIPNNSATTTLCEYIPGMFNDYNFSPFYCPWTCLCCAHRFKAVPIDYRGLKLICIRHSLVGAVLAYKNEKIIKYFFQHVFFQNFSEKKNDSKNFKKAPRNSFSKQILNSRYHYSWINTNDIHFV